MNYNIYIDKENLIESYITYYDPIKCKFEKINNTNLNEFKFLVYSIVYSLNIFMPFIQYHYNIIFWQKTKKVEISFNFL